MRIGIVQINASDDPSENLAKTLPLLDNAAKDGAELICTPEVTNIISTSRSHQTTTLRHEPEDETLKALCTFATDRKIWLNIGSLALKTNDPDGRFANRSFLVSPQGQITARYDKIHMFDVAVSAQETYRESAGYRPGETATLATMDAVKIGLTICYDMRFPTLYRQLAQAGAQIITVPSAFSPVTGEAHWHMLLRARAIETGCFVVAAAQTGDHTLSQGKPRSTYGHSLVVNPWGEILFDGGTKVGASVVDIDVAEVAKARTKIPALFHEKPYRLASK